MAELSDKGLVYFEAALALPINWGEKSDDVLTIIRMLRSFSLVRESGELDVPDFHGLFNAPIHWHNQEAYGTT